MLENKKRLKRDKKIIVCQCKIAWLYALATVGLLLLVPVNLLQFHHIALAIS